MLLLLGCSSSPTHSDQQTPPQTTGLLWKLESAELKSESYLFGTIHSDDERVTRLAPVVQKAFDQSKQFALEVELESSASQIIAMRMYYTDGQTLENVIGEKLFQRTRSSLKDYGFPEDMIAIMKPWAAFTVLNMPKPGKAPFLDAQLYQSAKTSGKKVAGLETLQEQVDVFDRMEIKTQIALLKATLDNESDIDNILDETISVYLSRDLSKMLALNDKYLKILDEDTANIFTYRLLVQRNQRMAERLIVLIKKHSTFIAVGALHLPGEKGLISLLRQKGYKLTPLY